MNTIWLNLIALAQIGLSGYLAFWLGSQCPHWAGLSASCFPIASLIFLVVTFRRIDPPGRKLLFSLLAPVALAGVSTLVVLSAGFLYGGFEHPLQTASTRFGHALPSDNYIPHDFADVLAKHVDKPRFGDWLSSHRPPLQTGIYLSEICYLRGQKGYEVLSALAQSLWIFALYILLVSFRVRSRTISLVLLTCLFSGFVFLNTLFVWPKLLAASYLLAFTAVFLCPKLLNENHRTLKAALGGMLLALALLSHGGSIFSALGVACALPLLRFRVAFSTRTVAAVVLACFSLYLPWMLYQKLYEPPGDRLLKWHLAAMIPPNNLSFEDAILKAYENIPAAQIVAYKLSNLETIYDHPVAYWAKVGSLFSAAFSPRSSSHAAGMGTAGALRASLFFSFVPSIGFLMFGPFALLSGLRRKNRSAEWKSAAALYLCLCFTLVAWCLLMFGPNTTTIHQGSYAANLMAMAAAVLALYAASPWGAWLFAAAQIVLNFLLYGVLMDNIASTEPLRLDMLVLFLISLLTMLVLLMKLRETVVLTGRTSERTETEIY